MADVPENAPEDLAPLPPTVSIRALSLWAASMRRAVIADGQTIVLVRSRAGMLDVDTNGTARHLAWLRALSGEQAERVYRDGVWATDLPLEAQTALARELGDLKGLLADLVAGGLIRTRLEPTLDVFVPGSRGTDDRLLSLRSDADFRDIAQAAKSRREPPAEESIKTTESDTGLDFGKGETLTVTEVVTRAEREFDRKYGYDNRMAKARVFLKGRFSRPAFESSFAKLLEGLPFAERTVEPKHELQKQFDAHLAELARRETDPAKRTLLESLAKGKDTFTIDELRAAYPGFAPERSGGAKVSVSLGLCLRIQGDGAWRVSRDGKVNGNAFQQWMAKDGRVVIRP